MERASITIPGMISIIVPFYNAEKYLPRCIDSILTQAYENIEIILINDGSTDNSSKICKEYENKNSKIHLYTKQNGGISDARNYGLGKAHGEYISFVDSDDYIDRYMYNVLLSDLESKNVDIATCDFKEFDDSTTDIKAEYSNTCEVLEHEEALRWLFTFDKYRDFAWNKLYRRKMFEQIVYPVGYEMEDLGTTYKLVDHARSISYNPSKLYFYYQRKDSILHSANTKLFRDKMALEQERFLYIKDKYPNMQENYTFFLWTIWTCYRYLPKNDPLAYSSIEILKSINNDKINRLNFKDKFKIQTLRFSPQLYRLFWIKSGI